MRLRDCHNFHDFRRLAKRRLPGPIFNYIDGAADDEVTYRRNTASFERFSVNQRITSAGADRVALEMVHDLDLKDEKYQRPETRHCLYCRYNQNHLLQLQQHFHLID